MQWEERDGVNPKDNDDAAIENFLTIQLVPYYACPKSWNKHERQCPATPDWVSFEALVLVEVHALSAILSNHDEAADVLTGGVIRNRGVVRAGHIPQ